MAGSDYDEYQSPGWVIHIKNLLDRGLFSNGGIAGTINPFPSNWRKVHDDAFHPKMIPIGPFKLPDELWIQMDVMEERKMRFLIRLLEGKLERWRSNGDKSRTTGGKRASGDRKSDGGQMTKAVLLDDLAKAMQLLEPKVQTFYSKDCHVWDISVEMMVVDGCFVVELLRLNYDLLHAKLPVEAIEDDPIFTNPRILSTLRRDLLLLENQLPFFVLEKVYELINKKNNIDHQQAVPLEVLAVTFFDPLLPQHNAAASKLDTKEPKAHLLEVFRSTFLKSASEKVHKKGKNRVKSRLNADCSIRGLVPHFASELEEAGVHFKKWKGHDLLDIEFSHGTLRVPPLPINDHTISLLLNFVAYELSVKHPEPFFTNYFMFWDSLVNSPRDIQIFRKHGIINHLGRDEELADLLLRCRKVIYDLDPGYLCNEIKEVNEYCERYYHSKYRVWLRSLIRQRFSSPWACLSLFAAIILLLLTALQTTYTVYPYYRPH